MVKKKKTAKKTTGKKSIPKKFSVEDDLLNIKPQDYEVKDVDVEDINENIKNQDTKENDKDEGYEVDGEEKNSKFGLFLVLGIIAGFIIFIVLMPFIFESEPTFDNQYTYNGFEFINNNGVWFSKAMEGNSLLQTSLRHGPLELENIPVNGDITKFKQTYQFVYITFDPRVENHDSYVTMSNAEISPNLVVHFGKDITVACSVDDPVCTESNIPVIDCSGVDDDKGVILINRVNDTKVVIENNCVTISGMGEDLVKASDRFLYGMYGIMK
jgi:hypothetical protein